MAHNLHFNETTGQHSFFSVKQKAWHGLGTIVQDYPTSAEALRFAGLDYQVEKRPLFTAAGAADESGTIPVLQSVATVRTDTGDVLGVVGKDYEVVQNVDAFAFFDSIVGGDGIQYETASALGKGERIFITAKLPSYIRVGREDLIEQYLFLTTSHDGYGSITAAFTPVRVVCANTLNAAMNQRSNTIKIRHTAGAGARLEMAHQLMGITNRLSSQLEAIFNHWSRVQITDREVKKLIQLALAPTKETVAQLQGKGKDGLSTYFQNMCEAAYEYALSHPSQNTDTTRGTLFGAYNAVTGYFQNVRTYKSEEAKLKSLLLNGSAQSKVQNAFRLCEGFAQKGNSALFLN
ncbi:DUF932 domain-containing protein [Flaviaesturariibacter amylovorans]|uniref:DUF932 domain-containing protein n=1 Tax=Flaviaesturariibacter amylovorans TaxID=1084520 RepID=A0ABP8HLX6_9BACT